MSAAVAGTFIDVIPAAWVFAAAALIGLPGAIAFFGVRYDGSAKVAARRSLATIARDVWADHKYRRLLLSFTVFGTGNLINVAVYPILLVDHFNASNSFVGAMSAVSSATMIVAYLVWGRMIDRGSSIRLTLVNTVVTLLVPIGYIAAADVWLLIPVAIVGGIVNAGGEITFFTNIVQIAPRDKIGEYATAQSLLMGRRGTAQRRRPARRPADRGRLHDRGLRDHGRRGATPRPDGDADHTRGHREPRGLGPERNPARAHRAREAFRDELVALVGRMESVLRNRARRDERRASSE
jgi:hypothetical protein